MKLDSQRGWGGLARARDSRSAPAVTVLMSVYNGERFVRQAIQSVLRQTWADFEFLIVNDGSTDRTREVISSFRDPRIRLAENPLNVGLTRSLNRGLELARGEFVARQDADDLSHPTRLAEQVAFMRANPEVALVGTQARVIDERGRVRRRPGWERAVGDAAIRFQLMLDNAFIHSSVLFRREPVWGRLGGYDANFRTGQDFELWSRVAARYPVRNLPLGLVDYRARAGSTAARYGEAHLGLSRAVVSANLGRYLGLTRVPEEWPRLVSGMHVSPAAVAEAELVKLADVACEIFGRFIGRRPEVRTDRGVLRVLACKLCQIACRLAGGMRREALAVFDRARRFDAATARSFAAKFFSLLLVGGRAWALLGPAAARARCVL